MTVITKVFTYDATQHCEVSIKEHPVDRGLETGHECFEHWCYVCRIARDAGRIAGGCVFLLNDECKTIECWGINTGKDCGLNVGT